MERVCPSINDSTASLDHEVQFKEAVSAQKWATQRRLMAADLDFFIVFPRQC
jgi:hypothetical protein